MSVIEEKIQAFENRIAKVYRHIRKIATKQGVTCFRIYDHDIPEFPFVIDQYGSDFYIAEYAKDHAQAGEVYQAWLIACFSAMARVFECTVDQLYFKKRRVITQRSEQYVKLDEVKNEIVVKEQGLSFLVNLEDYLDTGLFLDHRITRQMVREIAQDKVVINLFAYTGTFSVYAAAGGAKKVATVDLSNTYIDWAKRNMALNGFEDEERYQFFAKDVFRFLGEAQAQFGLADVIILDPPTFSNSKKMLSVLDTQRDHPYLIQACVDLLNPGGKVFFSTNYSKFKMNFEATEFVHVKDITNATRPFDFSRKMDRKCYLIQKM